MPSQTITSTAKTVKAMNADTPIPRLNSRRPMFRQSRVRDTVSSMTDSSGMTTDTMVQGPRPREPRVGAGGGVSR